MRINKPKINSKIPNKLHRAQSENQINIISSNNFFINSIKKYYLSYCLVAIPCFNIRNASYQNFFELFMYIFLIFEHIY